MTKTIRLTPNTRHLALEAVREAPEGYFVEIKEANRTLEQNAAQRPWLRGFAEQYPWTVRGEEVYMSEDDWKDVLTAAFKGETMRVAKGLTGGLVLLGVRTSKMGKKEFSEWMEFLIAEATMRGIEPVYKSPDMSLESYQQFREAR